MKKIIRKIKAKYNKIDRKVTTFYYRLFHKIDVGPLKENVTIFPSTGKGKFVSVYLKGEIIQIIDETGKLDEIRVLPIQYNHGIMIEKLKHGKVKSRILLDNEDLNNLSNDEKIINF